MRKHDTIEITRRKQGKSRELTYFAISKIPTQTWRFIVRKREFCLSQVTAESSTNPISWMNKCFIKNWDAFTSMVKFAFDSQCEY